MKLKYKEHSEVLESPTWYDVMQFFDRAIKINEDFHHIFLEDISEDGEICAGS